MGIDMRFVVFYGVQWILTLAISKARSSGPMSGQVHDMSSGLSTLRLNRNGHREHKPTSKRGIVPYLVEMEPGSREEAESSISISPSKPQNQPSIAKR